jgi:hypothetical protein
MRSSVTRSHIVSAKQHRANGVEQSSVQLLGSSEFYHEPVRVNYRLSAGSERSLDCAAFSSASKARIHITTRLA